MQGAVLEQFLVVLENRKPTGELPASNDSPLFLKKNISSLNHSRVTPCVLIKEACYCSIHYRNRMLKVHCSLLRTYLAFCFYSGAGNSSAFFVMEQARMGNAPQWGDSKVQER